MNNPYVDGDYLTKNPTWDEEDSPWKGRKINQLLKRNRLAPQTIAEIGCGSGGVLSEVSRYYPDANCDGYEISPQAYEIATKHSRTKLRIHLADLLSLEDVPKFDVLLAIDVFEHVPDYLGFLSKCKTRATHKVYHIPLEMHVSGILRDAYLHSRESVGHLHYFSAASALATLKDTEHEIIDYFYTASTIDLFRQHPAIKTAVANVPRWIISRFSARIAAKLLGGFSLLVLTR